MFEEIKITFIDFFSYFVCFESIFLLFIIIVQYITIVL
jgi:hypothetical protein